MPIDSADYHTRQPLSHMLTVVRALKTYFSKMASRDERRRIEYAVCEKEKYQCGKDWGGGGGVSVLHVCSKSGTYIITASSTGHVFQESGPSSFYLKL